MQPVITISERDWQNPFSTSTQQSALGEIEQGKVLYFPELSFKLDNNERQLIELPITQPNAKNISYNANQATLKGTSALAQTNLHTLENLMSRYQRYSEQLITNLLPYYKPNLATGRTSLRTLEAAGRVTSPKKDDNRLHVDAFPSSPMGNQRILRVFSNININDKPRVWHLGEPFIDVAKQFLPHIKSPIPGLHQLLKLCGITKQKRTHYDHLMLNLHNKMKLDQRYQQQAPKVKVEFAAGSTWIVYTDVTSHAAISGQHVLEQTFYLPYSTMQQPELSPQAILNQLKLQGASKH